MRSDYSARSGQRPGALVLARRVLLALFVGGCLSAALPTRADKTAVKMVVTAAFVSKKGMPVYDKLAAYLGARLKSDVSIVSGTSYEIADMLLQNGIIQAGFVCGLPYTHRHADNKYDLLAIPVMALKAGTWPDTGGYENVPGKYFSYTIVRKDSGLKRWTDLKGKRYAYNDQNSNSGYNMPRYKLVQLGARRWEDYFSSIVVSGSHEESIRMVSEGLVDASSVDSLVLDYDRHIGDRHAHNVRIIERLFPGGAGAPPVVISRRADPALRTRLQAILTGMHRDPEGQQILKEALMLRFDPPNDHNYDDIRRMEQAARDAHFIDHQP